MSLLRPLDLVVATGGCGCKSGFVTKPLVAQAIELSWTDIQALSCREGVQLAAVKGSEDFLNVERWNAMNKLFFS